MKVEPDADVESEVADEPEILDEPAAKTMYA